MPISRPRVLAVARAILAVPWSADHSRKQPKHVLYTDASDYGIGAVFSDGKNQFTRAQRLNHRVRQNWDIVHKEALAIKKAMENLPLANEPLLIATDARPVALAIDKGSSPSTKLNGLVKDIHLSAIKKGITPYALWIPGEHQPADALSRQLSNHHDWTLQTDPTKSTL